MVSTLLMYFSGKLFSSFTSILMEMLLVFYCPKEAFPMFHSECATLPSSCVSSCIFARKTAIFARTGSIRVQAFLFIPEAGSGRLVRSPDGASFLRRTDRPRKTSIHRKRPIAGKTRNQFAGNRTGVRIPPAAREKQAPQLFPAGVPCFYVQILNRPVVCICFQSSLQSSLSYPQAAMIRRTKKAGWLFCSKGM